MEPAYTLRLDINKLASLNSQRAIRRRPCGEMRRLDRSRVAEQIKSETSKHRTPSLSFAFSSYYLIDTAVFHQLNYITEHRNLLNIRLQPTPKVNGLYKHLLHIWRVRIILTVWVRSLDKNSCAIRAADVIAIDGLVPAEPSFCFIDDGDIDLAIAEAMAKDFVVGCANFRLSVDHTRRIPGADTHGWSNRNGWWEIADTAAFRFVAALPWSATSEATTVGAGRLWA